MSAVFSITPADKNRLAASDLPPRVRELLGALIGLCRQTLAAPLIDWLALSEDLTAGLSAPDRAAIFGGNAARVYGVAP